MRTQEIQDIPRGTLPALAIAAFLFTAMAPACSMAGLNRAPEVLSVAPHSAAPVAEGSPVLVFAEIHDDLSWNADLHFRWSTPELGTLRGDLVVDQPRIAFQPMPPLPPGIHDLTLEVTDPHGAITRAQVQVQVLPGQLTQAHAEGQGAVASLY